MARKQQKKQPPNPFGACDHPSTDADEVCIHQAWEIGYKAGRAVSTEEIWEELERQFREVFGVKPHHSPRH